VVYGGLTVLLGALVLLGVIHPSGSVDRKALRWHVGVWDLWFLVWGSCWRWLPSAIGVGRQHELGVMGQLTEPTVNEVLADRQNTHQPDEIRHPEHEPELRILRRGARLIRRDCGPRGIGDPFAQLRAAPGPG
jgi:hypothetical protein